LKHESRFKSRTLRLDHNEGSSRTRPYHSALIPSTGCHKSSELEMQDCGKVTGQRYQATLQRKQAPHSCWRGNIIDIVAKLKKWIGRVCRTIS
jgi:hypothetical protein